MEFSTEQFLQLIESLKPVQQVIYRIENKHGVGPYVGGICWDRSHEAPRNPGPRDEPAFEYLFECNWTETSKYLYGFSSPEQLTNWFDPEELQEMDRNGFKIKVVPLSQVENVVYGEKQVMFKPKQNENDKPEEIFTIGY